jgi:hypothetical protein
VNPGASQELPPALPSPHKPAWVVFRQDDHGHRFVVESGLSQQAAERMGAEFEAKGHKQLYWAQPEKA